MNILDANYQESKTDGSVSHEYKQVLMFYHLKTRGYVNTVYTKVSS